MSFRGQVVNWISGREAGNGGRKLTLCRPPSFEFLRYSGQVLSKKTAGEEVPFGRAVDLSALGGEELPCSRRSVVDRLGGAPPLFSFTAYLPIRRGDPAALEWRLALRNNARVVWSRVRGGTVEPLSLRSFFFGFL